MEPNTGPSFSDITHMLHPKSPYIGFDASEFPLDLQGWFYEDAFFSQLVERVSPDLIIEVGTWKGKSASCFGHAVKRLGKPSGVLCVDTWLGAREFWTTGSEPDGWWAGIANQDPEGFRRERYQALELRFGYPSVYYRFLANVVHQGLQDVLTPFPQTSRLAARWLGARGVHAQLIYIDGSHEYVDVLEDLNAYAPLLATGGIIIGDDYWLTDVRNAVNDFTICHGLKVEANSTAYIIQL